MGGGVLVVVEYRTLWCSYLSAGQNYLYRVISYEPLCLCVVCTCDRKDWI